MAVASLRRFIDRMERSALGAIGAGGGFDDEWRSARWAGELAADLEIPLDAATRVVHVIAAVTQDALDGVEGKRARLTAARRALADARLCAPTLLNSLAPGNSPKHMVYLLHGADRLLYVGITDRGPARLSEHYRRKPWFDLVDRTEFERYDTRIDAAARERYLIRTLRPVFNIQHNPAAAP